MDPATLVLTDLELLKLNLAYVEALRAFDASKKHSIRAQAEMAAALALETEAWKLVAYTKDKLLEELIRRSRE